MEKEYISKTVSLIARRDISDYISENAHMYKKSNPYRSEVWTCSQDWLFNKEQRKLNSLLGLHKTNKQIPHNKKSTD